VLKLSWQNVLNKKILLFLKNIKKMKSPSAKGQISSNVSRIKEVAEGNLGEA